MISGLCLVQARRYALLAISVALWRLPNSSQTAADNSEIFKQQEHKVEYFDDEEEEESEDHIVSEKSEFMNDSRYDTEQLNLPTHERGVSINFNKKNAPSSIAGSSNYLTKSNIGISGIH